MFSFFYFLNSRLNKGGIETVKTYILKAFDLKEHELKKTLLLQLNIFLIITTLLIVKPTINSLFLSELTSDALPLGYILTAIMALLGSYSYNWALERFTLIKVITMTFVFSIASLVFFGLAFQLNFARGFFLYIPYVWVAIFGLLTASQFWILANLVYNIREAKRVFGFIGAGAITGGIFGGYLTSILAKLLSAEGLLFVAAGLLVFCIPITKHVWKMEVPRLNTFQVSKRHGPKEKSPFKLIRKSKLLSHIAIVVGISVLVAKLVDYQYSDYAARLIPNKDDLASFFGFWFSTLSVVSLVIQLFLTPRIVGTFGVGKSLLWLPLGILLGSILLLLIPELWVVVAIKLTEGSLKQSVNKASTELLSIPIPIEIKKRTKTFIDVVVDSIATGVAGITLYLFIHGFHVSSTLISFLVIVLILVWVFYVVLLRKEYIFAFKELLTASHDNKNQQHHKKELPITSILETVKKVFAEGSEGQIIHMLHRTKEVQDERLFYPIKELLMHISPEVRILAIKNLYDLKTENLSKEMELLILDSNQEVTTEAFHYLAKYYPGDPHVLLEKYLNSEDHTISNAALIMLAEEYRHRHSMFRNEEIVNSIKYAMDGIAHIEDNRLREERLDAVLQAIGYSRLEKFYPFIRTHMESKDLEIQKSAIKAASRTLDFHFVEQLLHHIVHKETRQEVIEALYHYGEPVIDVLYHLVHDEKVSPEAGMHAIAVFEKFESPKAMRALLRLIDSEHMVEIEAIEALKRLKWSENHLEVDDKLVIDRVLTECQIYQTTLSVIHSHIVLQHRNKRKEENPELTEARNGLMNVLEHRIDRQLNRIFKLVGVKYPPGDIDPIFQSIVYGEEEQRINAIEFLDNILNNTLKRQLIPVAESMPVSTLNEQKLKKLNLKIYSEVECYNLLMERKDSRLKMAVLYLIEQSKSPKFKFLVERASRDSHPKIQNRAQHILKTIYS